MEKNMKEVPKTALENDENQLRVQDDEFRRVYANNVSLHMSQWDVGLIFGEIIGVRDDNKAIVLEKVKINMSKELAKVVAMLLGANISAYERDNGEIKLPEVVTENAAKTKSQKGQKVKVSL